MNKNIHGIKMTFRFGDIQSNIFSKTKITTYCKTNILYTFFITSYAMTSTDHIKLETNRCTKNN